jgi:hypothetical protein
MDMNAHKSRIAMYWVECINYTYIITRARDPPIISVKNTNKLISQSHWKGQKRTHSLKEPPKKREKCDNFRIRNCNWVTLCHTLRVEVFLVLSMTNCGLHCPHSLTIQLICWWLAKNLWDPSGDHVLCEVWADTQKKVAKKIDPKRLAFLFVSLTQQPHS